MPDRACQTSLANAALAALAICLFAGSARAEADNVQRGRELARANCARCHSIERTGESPFKPAPPFRMLHQPVQDGAAPLPLVSQRAGPHSAHSGHRRLGHGQEGRQDDEHDGYCEQRPVGWFHER